MGYIIGYYVGASFCCGASVSMVAIVFLGSMGLREGLVPVIAFSILLHVSGLLLVLSSVLNLRWRAERAMYYDWGL